MREPHGATFTSVNGDSNFVLSADGSSWSYNLGTLNTLTWDMAYPGPVWPAWNFSGTILQRSGARAIDPRPTTLVDDTATTLNTTPITIDVLANDGLPGEATLDPTTLTLLDSAGNPTTQLSVNGGVFTLANSKVVFTPTAGFTGTVPAVQYAVTNVDNITGKATIRVTVTATTPPTTDPTPTNTATTPPTNGTTPTGSTTSSANPTTQGLAMTGLQTGTLATIALLAA
ncbi:hypothetical protein, partial [Arthrobacter sp. GMC3]|uniref:Ig-like domain-containing protein n=1 Tax=Arthrobacter sp. GMC3 TaxID=2058894 RepID=UPI0015E2F45C